MKTKIFTTVAIVILTTSLVEGTIRQNEGDSAIVLAYTGTVKIHSGSGNEVSANTYSVSNANVLENWVAGREAWEQEGTGFEAGNNMMEAVNLEEWVSGMESWEQESDAPVNNVRETVSLEDWVAGREQWEQEESEADKPKYSAGTNILGKWIAERENWECK